MKRNNSSVSIPALFPALALMASGIPLVAQQATFWQIIAAALLIAATSLILHLTQQQFGPGYGSLMIPAYLALASANPKALILNPLHPATLAVAASILFCLKYFKENQNLKDAFAGSLFLGMTVCFFPPAIWLFPFAILLGLTKSVDNARFSFASVCGLLLAPLSWAVILYLYGGIPQSLEFLSGIGTGAVPVWAKSIFYSPATIIRAVTVAVFATIAAVTLRNILLFFAILALLAVAVIFFTNSGEPFCLWTSIAAVFPLNAYLCDRNTRHRKLYIALICLILIAERITFYL